MGRMYKHDPHSKISKKTPPEVSGHNRKYYICKVVRQTDDNEYEGSFLREKIPKISWGSLISFLAKKKSQVLHRMK